MPQLQSVLVDWDIYKMIEAERASFDEPHYVALRRLLGLPAFDTSPEPEAQAETGLPWVEDDVNVPHRCPARMRYRGQIIPGQFLNSYLVVNGKSYRSLSAAARDNARTKDGTKPQLNGWLYWEVKLPGETEWRSLGELRNAAAAARRSL
jgi:hypothetical protein